MAAQHSFSLSRYDTDSLPFFLQFPSSLMRAYHSLSLSLSYLDFAPRVDCSLSLANLCGSVIVSYECCVFHLIRSLCVVDIIVTVSFPILLWLRSIHSLSLSRYDIDSLPFFFSVSQFFHACLS